MIVIGVASSVAEQATIALHHLRLRWQFKVYHFDMPARAAIAALFAISPARCEGVNTNIVLEHVGFAPDELTRTLIEYGRQFSPEFWTLAMANHWRLLGENPATARGLCIEVTSRHEADFIRRQGGFIVHLSDEADVPVTLRPTYQANDFHIAVPANLDDLRRELDNLVAECAIKHALEPIQTRRDQLAR